MNQWMRYRVIGSEQKNTPENMQSVNPDLAAYQASFSLAADGLPIQLADGSFEIIQTTDDNTYRRMLTRYLHQREIGVRLEDSIPPAELVVLAPNSDGP